MKTAIRNILKDSFLYAFSIFCSKIFALFLIPIYTNHFTTSNYGIVELASGIFFILVVIFKAGTDEAFFRLSDIEDRKALFSTLFNFSLISGTILLIIGFFIYPDLSREIFGNSEKACFITSLVFILAFAELLSSIPLSALRKDEKSKSYAIINIFTSIINFLINLYMIFFLYMDAETIVIAMIISTILNAICYFWLTKKYFQFSFDFKIIKKALRFGLPLIPATLSTLSITLSDRYFLNYYISSSSVGIYSLAYNLGMIVFYLGVTSFSLAWPTYFYKLVKKNDSKEIISRLFSFYFIILSFLFLSLITSMPDLFKVFISDSFKPALELFPLIALSYCFFGGYTFFSFATFSTDRTHENGLILLFSAVLNLVFNYLFIPYLGMMGAAIATVLSYGIMFLMMYFRSFMLTSIKLEFLRLTFLSVSISIFYLLIHKLHFNCFINILTKSTVLGIAFIFLLYADHKFSGKKSMVSLFID